MVMYQSVMQNILKLILLVSLVAVSCIYRPSLSIADGWHNPILKNKGFKEWAKDITPLLPQKDGTGISKKKGELDSRVETIPQGDVKNLEKNKEILKRKGWDAVKILAHMEPENIIPTEFPNFDMAGIPQCRRDCKKFLMKTGYIGASVVVNQLVNALMGMGGFEGGIIISPSYEQDMIDVLRTHYTAGRVSADQVQSLLNACKGTKPDDRTMKLARMVRESIDLSQIELSTLCNMVINARDRKWHNHLIREFKKRLKDAALNERVSILRIPELTPTLTKATLESVVKEFDNLSPLSRITLLTIPELSTGSRRIIVQKLQSGSKLQRSQLNELREILKLIDFPDADVSALAKKHGKKLYLQAPINICIRDSADANLNGRQFLRGVIDQKITRANDQRKIKYKKTAKNILESPPFDNPQKREAIHLLEQLNSASILVSSLMNIDSALQIHCGKTLQRITGQSFGPSQNVSQLKLRSIQKKWVQWLENNPGFD